MMIIIISSYRTGRRAAKKEEWTTRIIIVIISQFTFRGIPWKLCCWIMIYDHRVVLVHRAAQQEGKRDVAGSGTWGTDERTLQRDCFFCILCKQNVIHCESAL